MKVLIQVRRSVQYASIVEMGVKTYRSLYKRLRSPDRAKRVKASNEANNLVDIKDWLDDELESVEVFEPAKT